MKKYLSLFIATCLCLSLIACNKQEEASETEATSTLPPDDVFPYEIDENGNPVISHPAGNWKLSSYSAYEKFLESCQQPDDFITFDTLDSLGQFYEFTPIPRWNRPDYSYRIYDYTFTDICGHQLYLQIRHLNKTDNEIRLAFKLQEISDYSFPRGELSYISVEPAPDSLTQICTEINNVKYYYRNTGEIISIRWQSGDVYYDLYGEMLSEEHLSASVIAGILNADTSFYTLSLIAEPIPMTVVILPKDAPTEGPIEIQP